MSKILKRTLTLALIFCMLLSVMAPLASAEDPVSVTYDFKVSKSFASASGEGWSAFKSNLSSKPSFTTGAGLSFTTTTTSSWFASIKINVPKTANYCIYAETRNNTGYSTTGQFLLVKADADYNGQTVADYLPTSGSSSAYANVRSLGYVANMNYRVTPQDTSKSTATEVKYATQADCYHYLGSNVALEEGEYLIIIRGNSTGYQTLRALTLVESTDAAPFIEFVSGRAEDQRFSADKFAYALATDLVAEDATLTLGGQRFDLNGKSLTVKNIYGYSSLNGVAQVGYNVFGGFTDASTDKTGLVKTTSGNAPVLPHVINGNADKLPLYNETTGAYEFVTPTTQFALKQDVTNPIIDEAAGTAKFVFKVTLPETAYAMALAGNNPLTITADWTINGEKQDDELSFEGYMEQWIANADGNVFTVTIAGFDKVEENTTVTVTPKVAVGTNVITLETLSYEKTVA